jgi:hypothetical protein
MLLLPDKEAFDKMAEIRLAKESDIPRILELYHELTIITTQAERSLNTSWDDYRRVFAEISSNPRRELLVAEYQGEVVGTVALFIIPNLSHGATPYALVENLWSITNTGVRASGKSSWNIPSSEPSKRDATGSSCAAAKGARRHTDYTARWASSHRPTAFASGSDGY